MATTARRYLVIANHTLAEAELSEAIRERLETGPSSFYVLVPNTDHGDLAACPLRQAAKDEVEAEELAGEGRSLWTARVNPKTQARPGRTIDLAVDTSGFHFFDKDSGYAIGLPTRPGPA
jgi:multiple sugar transport system ATP-binding protein